MNYKLEVLVWNCMLYESWLFMVHTAGVNTACVQNRCAENK